MQIVIDIPEKLAEKEHWYTDEEMWTVIKAAQNGTPIPDNATNGDVMRIIFPKIGVYDEWYDEPYQKGSKE